MNNKQEAAKSLILQFEDHVCRWAFIYVIATYTFAAPINYFYFREPADYAGICTLIVSLYYLGIIGLSKLLLKTKNL